MDEFRNNHENEASEQTTPFQTPVRGAEEEKGAGYQNAGAAYTDNTSNHTGFSDMGNGGSTPPPPHNNAYEQWSGGKKPGGNGPKNRRDRKRSSRGSR